MKDTYLTISGPAKGSFRDRGSKFLSFAAPVADEEGTKHFLEALKKEYHDARHHCYAWRLGTDGSQARANDDGEPGNSAGNPILNQIAIRNLTHTMVVVVRYFGGTLLGVSGLINAYRTAAADALDHAKVLKKYITLPYMLEFGYESMNEVMKLLDDLDMERVTEDFTEMCRMRVNVRLNHKGLLENRIKRIGDCKLTPIEPE